MNGCEAEAHLMLKLYERLERAHDNPYGCDCANNRKDKFQDYCLFFSQQAFKGLFVADSFVFL